ncbi:MAG: hypothetical protein ACK5GZ_18030 [Cyanobium sp.]
MQALCFRCNAGKRRPARGGLCVLRAGGQRAGAAGERIRKLCIAVADLVIKGQAMSFQIFTPRAMSNCQVQR